MGLIHFFRTPGASAAAANTLLRQAREKVSANIQAIDSEFCFNIKSPDNLTTKEIGVLRWLLSETFQPNQFSPKSFLEVNDRRALVEVGPRLNFSTAWSTNAVSVCKACGLEKIERIERSRRYLVHSDTPLDERQLSEFLSLV
ncbi:uncharacterized protein METZ01_LOCUS178336, partial [marine metagenome]